MKSGLLASLAVISTAAPSSAAITTTAVETFDETLELATWRLGTSDRIDPPGGGPAAFLHNPSLDSAVPSPSYVGPIPSPFVGDYRAAGVVALGLDVNVFAASIGVDHSRAISLVLTTDMGTPDDPLDDCDVYFVGRKPLPAPGTGWRSYDFRVPSDDTRLSAAWTVRCGPYGPTSQDEAWNRVITDVTHVSFQFSDPGVFWYFQVWDLGIDNVRISFTTPR